MSEMMEVSICMIPFFGLQKELERTCNNLLRVRSGWSASYKRELNINELTELLSITEFVGGVQEQFK